LGLLFWRDYLTGRRIFLAQSYFDFVLMSFLVALRRSVPLFSLCIIRTAPTQIQLLDHFAQIGFNPAILIYFFQKESQPLWHLRRHSSCPLIHINELQLKRGDIRVSAFGVTTSWKGT
jgi:hypothetical protein